VGELLGALTTIVAALITAVVALRTAGHRERRAVKEEAEILAALPPDVPSADILRQTLDRRLRRYVLHQTSRGRELIVLGAWVFGIWVLAAGAALYLGSDNAPGWADGLGELWDPLDGSGVWPAVLGYGLLLVGLALWWIEARSVYRLGPAGPRSRPRLLARVPRVLAAARLTSATLEEFG
jgi:hypothetical protein